MILYGIDHSLVAFFSLFFSSFFFSFLIKSYSTLLLLLPTFAWVLAPSCPTLVPSSCPWHDVACGLWLPPWPDSWLCCSPYPHPGDAPPQNHPVSSGGNLARVVCAKAPWCDPPWEPQKPVPLRVLVPRY